MKFRITRQFEVTFHTTQEEIEVDTVEKAEEVAKVPLEESDMPTVNVNIVLEQIDSSEEE